jgi:hypothetical protein
MYITKTELMYIYEYTILNYYVLVSKLKFKHRHL